MQYLITSKFPGVRTKLSHEIRRLTTSSMKCCTPSFGFDYERIKGTENAKWLQLTGKESMERFIPVTRKTLLRKILEDAKVVTGDEMEEFQKFATKMDSALYIQYKKQLDSLKVLIEIH